MSSSAGRMGISRSGVLRGALEAECLVCSVCLLVTLVAMSLPVILKLERQQPSELTLLT